jgi:hypothetical protein
MTDAPVISISSGIVKSSPSPISAYGYHTSAVMGSDISDDNHHQSYNSRNSSEYSLSTPGGHHHPGLSEIDTRLASRLERIKLPKPPIPTSPKPQFNRTTSGQLSHRKISPSPSVRHMSTGLSETDSLPPTTNFLQADERADLIKKTRKLQQMFGQTPGADALASQDTRNHLASSTRPGHQRGAFSMQVDPSTSPTWPPFDGTQYLTASGRRHSSPLSPSDFPFLSDQSRHPLSFSTRSMESESSSTHRRRRSTTSIFDLSDDETNDGRKRRPPTDLRSAPLFPENMTEAEQAEEDRRRKREKLVRLHRFLGSRVPMDLVLGLKDDAKANLPPLSNVPDERETRKPWLRRRRSSSAVALPVSWSDDIDRLKEELDNREKAVNVRRALKMEKVFTALFVIISID